jgi:hypothetical protein
MSFDRDNVLSPFLLYTFCCFITIDSVNMNSVFSVIFTIYDNNRTLIVPHLVVITADNTLTFSSRSSDSWALYDNNH